MRNLVFVYQLLNNNACWNRKCVYLVKEEALDSQSVLSCNAIVFVNVSSFSSLALKLVLIWVSK